MNRLIEGLMMDGLSKHKKGKVKYMKKERGW